MLGLLFNPIVLALLTGVGGFVFGFVQGADDSSAIVKAFKDATQKAEQTLAARAKDIAAKDELIRTMEEQLEDARNASTVATDAVCVPADDGWLRKHSANR